VEDNIMMLWAVSLINGNGEKFYEEVFENVENAINEFTKEMNDESNDKNWAIRLELINTKTLERILMLSYNEED
jgi:hypothetical protein